MADILQTRSDERIFALGDWSDLTGAHARPPPSTAQAVWQRALFLVKSLATHVKSGAPLRHFKYRDMAALYRLRGRMAPMTRCASYSFLKVDAVKGWLAHMGHATLYRMHRLDVNRYARGLVIWLAANLRPMVQPSVRTS